MLEILFSKLMCFFFYDEFQIIYIYFMIVELLHYFL